MASLAFWWAKVLEFFLQVICVHFLPTLQYLTFWWAKVLEFSLQVICVHFLPTLQDL
ncbi:MAG: hypothetical protein F6K50_41250 [Moorea sp. SIO3I7]|uniref:hypothetical protein n=1 Tax=unclassified Moorena TaxID=2683338 RepID=UPI0013BEE97D|nr:MULTISPECIES: hypothetical protein [unclassified Moorena]NEO01589.1 hypothetical protein [Moorena sp. SIO3I7]NEO10414.1 hypothetical protein [Moorena sp. SIO3I8]NEO25099.1 hypothetical protein [Moorena sp. SIO4A5]NEQ62315.1 hypothetical protein [Moorena sp. SIO4A1]